MILIRTPLRLSFFGGGSDYPSYYNFNKSVVVSASINKFSYVAIRDLVVNIEQNKFIINVKNTQRTNNINQIEQPVVRSALKIFKKLKNIETTYFCDLPARTGLGTSSAFAVGLVHAFMIKSNMKFTKESIAKKSIYIEKKILRENVGIQDQYTSSYGGLLKIISSKSKIEVNQLKYNKKIEKLIEENFLMFYSGIQRFSQSILKNQKNNKLTDKYILNEMVSLALEFSDMIQYGNLNLIDVGRMMDFNWNLKKKLNPLTSSVFIDELYSYAKNLGAYGGKIMGAGGGGFFLFIVPTSVKLKFIKQMANKNIHLVKYKLEKDGSKNLL